jgi:alpha-L-fucosidase
MWDSELTQFDAMDMGPKQDMKFITTFHHQWLYAWYPTWKKSLGTTDPANEDLYGPIVAPEAWGMAEDHPELLPDQKFNERWHSRVLEVIDKYQLDLERARMSELKEFPWLTDDSMDWGSWCNVSDPDYKSTDRLIDFLVDVVSKNGCVLLNVTPTEVIEGHLSERANADNTAEDIRFTQNGEKLYAICLDLPESTEIVIRSLSPTNGIEKGAIKSVTLLGSEQELKWDLTEAGMEIQLQDIPNLKHAISFRIKTQSTGKN